MSMTNKADPVSPKPLVEQFHDMLHRDQTGLSAGLAEVLKTVGGFWWATESRGCYEWDDARYRDEMGNMLRAIQKAAQDALDRWKRGPLPCCVLERELHRREVSGWCHACSSYTCTAQNGAVQLPTCQDLPALIAHNNAAVDLAHQRGIRINQLEADAGRYRWLRDHAHWGIRHRLEWYMPWRERSLDGAIDAAIASSKDIAEQSPALSRFDGRPDER
jgi:hypothetical protein